MSNKGIELIAKYYELQSSKKCKQMSLDKAISSIDDLKNQINNIDRELQEIRNKAPELFEQLEKEYE